MTKELLINHITKIFDMNLDELNARAVAISLSNVDSKARYFLNKAIDMRRDELARKYEGSAMAVVSELDPSEI